MASTAHIPSSPLPSLGAPGHLQPAPRRRPRPCVDPPGSDDPDLPGAQGGEGALAPELVRDKRRARHAEHVHLVRGAEEPGGLRKGQK